MAGSSCCDLKIDKLMNLGGMEKMDLKQKLRHVMDFPKEGIDFNEFLQNLEAGDLYLKYYKVPVSLRIPRFNLEHKVEDMPKFFKKWGIQTIFDSTKANLSGLSDTPHYVAKIIHQANIGMNEKGTEASAATLFAMAATDLGPGALSRRDWSIPFVADRPFVFMINNGDFIGVYAKGSSELHKEYQKREEEHKKEQEEWEEKHQSSGKELIVDVNHFVVVEGTPISQ